jgi:dihydrofolate synthase/folylpolyglutamate synthase
MSAFPTDVAGWLAYQSQQHPQEIAMGLDRVRAVHDRMSLSKPVTVTVGGTNGKGSTCAYLAEIYQQAGYKVGKYTSPHLLRYNERIVINGVEASDAQLCQAFERIEAARTAANVALTYFEYSTLAALWLFQDLDVQILEVGLGGRLDAVNIVDAEAAVITSIGLDHTDWLGDTREKIGFEKAGIFRSQQLAICADPEPPSSLFEAADALELDLQLLGQHFGYRDVPAKPNQPQRWRYWDQDGLLFLPLPALKGKAQLQNAAAAVAVVRGLQATLAVAVEHIEQGLARARLLGRMQEIGKVTLDVAHNAEAAQVLADSLPPRRRYHLVLGMMRDKPVEAVIAALKGKVSAVSCLSLPAPRGLSASELASRITGLTVTGCFEDIDSALQSTKKARSVLVCGSFLTVAAALSVPPNPASGQADEP